MVDLIRKVQILEGIKLLITEGEEPEWRYYGLNVDSLMSLSSDEFKYYKAFQVNESCVILILSSGITSNHIYLARLIISDKEFSFEKPKLVSDTHKLYILNACVRSRSNIICYDSHFYFFNELTSKVISLEANDLKY